MMLTEKEVKKTGIFRALQLGDLLCSIPAIRAFKKTYPESRLTLIGLPWASGFAARFSHYFSDFIYFPGYPGLPEQEFDAAAFEQFIDVMYKKDFDLLIQLQGNGTIVNTMLKAFSPGNFAGYDPLQDSITPHSRLLKYPDHGHEINRHLTLMAFLGAISEDTALEFPITQKDREEFARLDLPLGPGKYVCIHPGSRGSWRQWPPLYFAAVGDYCNTMGYKVVLTGTSNELQIVKHVASLMKQPPVIAAGKTSLGSLAVLIEQAAALICNCTGVSHMASALKIPAVVISMDGEPERWAPKNSELQRTIDWTKNPEYDTVFKEVIALFFRL